MKKFIKKLTRSVLFIRLVGLLLFLIFSFLRFFYRFKPCDRVVEIIEANDSVIGAFWHEHLIVMAFFLLGIPRSYRKKVGILVSPSKDGEFLAQFLNYTGVTTLRASSNKKNVSGTLHLLKTVNRGNLSLAIAIDGPRGPRHSIKNGIFLIAKSTKMPIIPLTFSIPRFYAFRSWDRCVFPYPFQTIHIDSGNELKIDDMEKVDTMSQILKGELGND